MKHLKGYNLFESQEILLASVENAIMNYNIQLIKDMVTKLNFDPSMNDNFALKLASRTERKTRDAEKRNKCKQIIEYLLSFPSVIEQACNKIADIIGDSKGIDYTKDWNTFMPMFQKLIKHLSEDLNQGTADFCEITFAIENKSREIVLLEIIKHIN